jgi:hypothetical protein
VAQKKKLKIKHIWWHEVLDTILVAGTVLAALAGLVLGGRYGYEEISPMFGTIVGAIVGATIYGAIAYTALGLVLGAPIPILLGGGMGLLLAVEAFWNDPDFAITATVFFVMGGVVGFGIYSVMKQGD